LPDGSSLDLLHEVNRRNGYGRTLYAAVKRDGRALGLLSFLKHDGEHPFTAYQARFAEGIAHQAAIALANARLFDDLQTANRAKSEFVSTMSHELRTPLHVIMGYTEMLEDLPEEERHQAIDKIRAASRELLDLIDTTLDLSRMEARRDPPTFEPLRVGDLWEELASEFAALPRTSAALRECATALRCAPTAAS
jgi:signal transduction histidine kinase